LLTVVEKLAAACDTDPLDLPPLHDYIDTDALEILVGSPTARDTGINHLRFQVDDHQVSIDGDGTVAVVALGGDASVPSNTTRLN
jgi:hypothetical protein